RAVADIGAQHEQAAMREVDDAHNAEDEREPARDEEQNRCLRERVQALCSKESGNIHSLGRSACSLLPRHKDRRVGNRARSALSAWAKSAQTSLRSLRKLDCVRAVAHAERDSRAILPTLRSS